MWISKKEYEEICKSNEFIKAADKVVAGHEMSFVDYKGYRIRLMKNGTFQSWKRMIADMRRLNSELAVRLKIVEAERDYFKINSCYKYNLETIDKEN